MIARAPLDGHRHALARLLPPALYPIARWFKAPLERFLAGSDPRRRDRQHLFLRIAVARSPRPSPPSQHLETAGARRLHKAIVSVLARALECCLHPAPDFRKSGVVVPRLENILRAYGREENPAAAAVSRSGALRRRPVNLLLRALVSNRRLTL